MYYWRAFNSDGELLCQAPITIQKAEAPVLKDGTIRDVGIYIDEHFLMTVGLSQPRDVTQGDFFCLAFSDDVHVWVMGLALRFPIKRVSGGFYKIQQAVEMSLAYQAGKPVHYLSPQALKAGCIPDEKQQSIRWWNPRLLVQRVKKRFVDRV